jgi:cell division protein FtsB
MEEITGFAFGGLYSMLILSMALIFFLSIRLYQVSSRLDSIEKSINITKDEVEQIRKRIDKLKPLLE